MTVAIHPLTADRWDDFAALCRQMGPNRGCWCMFWRTAPGAPRSDPNRVAALALAATAPAPGLIAYDGRKPVGWVAVAPRTAYARLNAGRDTAPVDDDPGAWAVPCFFVTADHRGRGVSAALLDAAVAFAAEHGAGVVDGVPGDPATKARSVSASYTGTLATFERAGFSEVARRSRSGRVIVRRRV